MAMDWTEYKHLHIDVGSMCIVVLQWQTQILAGITPMAQELVLNGLTFVKDIPVMELPCWRLVSIVGCHSVTLVFICVLQRAQVAVSI